MNTATQKSQLHNIAQRLVPVLAVIHQGRAIVRAGKVNPLVGANLKAGHVPAGIPVGWPFQASKLNVAGNLVRVYVHRESGCAAFFRVHASSLLYQKSDRGSPLAE
jgi:hypothetical protein